MVSFVCFVLCGWFVLKLRPPSRMVAPVSRKAQLSSKYLKGFFFMAKNSKRNKHADPILDIVDLSGYTN